MPPAFLAFLVVAALFAVFWATRSAPTGGKKWGTRFAAGVVLLIGMSTLAEGAPAAARAGELTVYFAVPAVVGYLVLGKLVTGRAKSGR